MVELYPDYVPKTVENFVGLVKKHYYDEVIFHRVIPKFVRTLDRPLGAYSSLCDIVDVTNW